MMTTDEHNQLREHMAMNGIIPVSTPKKYGTFYRFRTLGASKNSLSGWFIEKPDGAIIYGDFRLGDGCYVFRPYSSRKYYDREEDYSSNFVNQILRQLYEEEAYKAARRTEQEQAAITARAIMAYNRPASSTHRYLVSKLVKPYGLRETDDGYLIIPMFDENHQICSVQMIDEDGNKKFLSHGRIQGTYMLLGDPEKNDKLLMVEGYATGASAYEQTGIATIVAFNAGNLVPTTKTIRSMFPNHPIIILADNDNSSHTGEIKAKLASSEDDKTTYILIPTPGMDANDFVNAGGDLFELIRRTI